MHIQVTDEIIRNLKPILHSAKVLSIFKVHKKYPSLDSFIFILYIYHILCFFESDLNP